jgi:hypothetical protein
MDELKATRRNIGDKRRALERKRQELIREATKEINDELRALQDHCKDETGHAGMQKCQGEMAGPNMAGQWPFSCFDCGYVEYR